MEPSQYNEIIIKHHCKSHYSNDEDIHKLLNYIAGNGKKKQKREYPKVCVNLQTDVRYNYSVWRLFLWQEKKTAHKKQQ